MKTMQQLQHFLTMAELTPEALTDLLVLAKTSVYTTSAPLAAFSGLVKTTMFPPVSFAMTCA